MSNIKYASIRSLDISNGEGTGVSLFVQGCHFHCKNCFNQSTWDFNAGKDFTEDVKEQFFKLIDRPYIKRITILGGEPLAEEHLVEVTELIIEIRNKYPDKRIWMYTGYKYEDLLPQAADFKTANRDNLNDMISDVLNNNLSNCSRMLAISLCDVLVDGRYIDELKDYTLRWRGSSNQRVIDVQKTFSNPSNNVVLYEK